MHGAVVQFDLRASCGSEESSKGASEAFTMAVVCPECDNPITVDADEVEEGETVQCDECGLEMEVVSVDPLELAPVDVLGYDDEDDVPVVEEDDE
jgi:alpha-aminoadipate/glutamate carrier protein LysW